MKRILITGASGFVGKNLKESLSDQYMIFAPAHSELELTNYTQLERYVLDHGINIVIHSATSSPEACGAGEVVVRDMKMFSNIVRLSDQVEKVLYFGSGAEFDKRFDIRMVREEEFGWSVPASEYGMGKYLMNKIARQSNNIYNLRLFGIFGKYEPWRSRFLSNLCCKAVFDFPMTVRHDCYFDFLFINDLPDIVTWFMEHVPRYHDYNICQGREYQLTELAQLVRKVSGKDLPIVLLSGERNLDYSADNHRLKQEFPALRITQMEKAITSLYGYYDTHRSLIDVEILKYSR